MWGSAFTDLAKKAQEIQEQAKEQVSHVAAPSFFNLDAMQQDGQEDQGKEMFTTPQPSDHAAAKRMSIPQQQQQNNVNEEEEDDDLQDFISNDDPFAAFDSLPTQVVTPKKESVVKTTPRSTLTTKKSTPTKTTTVPKPEQAVSTDSVEKEKGGGWEDDDGLLDIVESNSGDNYRSVQQETKVFDDAVDMRNSGEMDSLPMQQVAPVDTVDPKKEKGETDAWTDNFGIDRNAEDIPSQQSLDEDESILEPHAVVENQSSVKEAVAKDSPVHEVEKEATTVSLVDTANDSSPLLLPVEEANTATVEQDTGFIAEEEDKDSEADSPLVESNEKDAVVIHGMNDANANVSSDSSHASESHDRIEKDIGTNQDTHTESERHVEEQVPPAVPVSSETTGENAAPPTDDDTDQFEIVSSAESQAADSGGITAVSEYEDTVDAKLESNERIEHEAEKLVEQHEDSSNDAMANDSHPAADAAEPDVQTEGVESADTAIAEKDMPEVSSSSIDAGDVTYETNKALLVDETAADPSRASQPEQSQFLSQESEQNIQQLRNAHHAEIARLKEQYENRIQEALDSFNHDHCESERREMEQRFLNQFRGKEQQVQELMRENEGCKLRIDALKREVEGTQALLEQRDSTMGSVSASHSKNLELLEQRIQELNNAKSLAKAETDRVKEELQAAKTELGTSNEAYSSLKARVKVVATELKERRIECRNLAGTVMELKESNEGLETQLANLQSQLSDRDKSQTEKDKDVLKLREQMESLELELHKTKSELKDRDSVGEKALSSYKKKAQNALAVANARAAAANQAKEEAELEATTARTMSEEAIQRASITESAGKKALAEAKDYVREMETEKADMEKKLSEACESLETTRAESQHLKNILDASSMAQDKLANDVKLITHEREEERGRNRELQRQLAENQQKVELLYEEVETLREDLRQANAIVTSSSNDNSEKESRPTVWTHPTRASDELPDRSDAEGTIAMLEGDLRDANRAIKELKDALKNAIAEQGSNGYGNGVDASSSMGHYNGNPRHASGADSGGNESTPLFYAMEKQAELTTARDEINRLANLLGDAETSKMEAFEAMDAMRRRMEEAEARLHRQEKFEGASRPTTTAATTVPSADDNANLEYLKNIMLSYLNAKSLTEKKALVPVIAAVLCLTPEEQAMAVKNIDESGGIEGVGRTLFESIGGSLGR